MVLMPRDGVSHVSQAVKPDKKTHTQTRRFKTLEILQVLCTKLG